MRFLSLFSGIEAASVAWEPLGWQCVAVSEIEPFPSAVLKTRYPDVPNLGCVEKITEEQIAALGAIDLVVFGSPCQDLSVAGKQKGFKGERSGLFYTAINIIRWARQNNGCRFALWENVPGAFSSNKGEDFATVVSEMAGLRDVAVPTNGWGHEGAALGDDGLLEWSILDAQWFGVAQRRRRVFALTDFGDWQNRPPILLEPTSLRGDTAPSREKGQKITPNAGAGFTSSSFGGYREGVGTLRAQGGDLGGGSETLALRKWPADVASTLNASFGSKLGLENQHIDGGAPLFVLGQAFGIPGNWIGRKPENGGNSTQFMCEVAPSQTATDKHGVVAFNSRQDPVSGDVFGALDACSPQAQAIAIQGSIIGRKPENGPQGSGYDDTGVCFTQTAVDRHAVVIKNSSSFKAGQGAGAGSIGYANELTPTLTSADSGSNRVPSVMIEKDVIGWDEELNASHDLTGTLLRGGAGGRHDGVMTSSVVRRLTPIECERLQGFPDNYTKVLWRNKYICLECDKSFTNKTDSVVCPICKTSESIDIDCPDGHRYKALGNSMAVPVMRWIGNQIQKALLFGKHDINIGTKETNIQKETLEVQEQEVDEHAFESVLSRINSMDIGQLREHGSQLKHALTISRPYSFYTDLTQEQVDLLLDALEQRRKDIQSAVRKENERRKSEALNKGSSLAQKQGARASIWELAQ